MSDLKTTYISDPKLAALSGDLKYEKGDIAISFSQFSTYMKCPKSWELKNIRKIKDDTPSIHLIFGNAIHTIFQEYLRLCKVKTIKAADELDFSLLLKEELKREYLVLKSKTGTDFSTKQEMFEFYEDGLEILNYLRKKRLVYFSKDMELIGIEMPIMQLPHRVHKNIKFTAYLDLVFRTKGKPFRYLILDLKTSTRGWKDWDKKDKGKTSQVILYKKFFADQYKVPIEQIDVSFLILKRKLPVDSEYPVKRFQEFSPAQGTTTTKQIMGLFDQWIYDCFDDEGKHNTVKEYPALSGKNYNNCKFCPYNEKEDLCPRKNRIPEN